MNRDESSRRSDNGTPLDWQKALDRVGGSEETLRDLIEVFFEECPQLMGDMRRAISTEDATGLQRAAHTLKGTVDVFAAGRAVELAARLERLGEEGRVDDAAEVFERLESEIGRIERALEEKAED